MCARCGKPASRYHGPQERRPQHARRGNKGAKAAVRWLKRKQAIDRNADTLPEKRSRKRGTR